MQKTFVFTTAFLAGLGISAAPAQPAKSASPMVTTAPPAVTPAPTAPGTPDANEYQTEAAAKRSCGTDPVVWANLKSKAVHPMGDRYYGKTQDGAYMCQSVAVKQGMHLPM